MKSPLVRRRKGSHKQWVVAKLRSQIFIPIANIETTDENLVEVDFENWFHFISNGGKKEQYAQVTYLEQTKFMYSWCDFKKNEGILLVNNARKPLVWWRLSPWGSNQP
jgi:hypothetical protein